MNPKDATDRWIQERVAGLTFADIGGVGVGAVNERVTFAAKCGAGRCVMADIQETTAKDWGYFEKSARMRGWAISWRCRASMCGIGN